MMLGGSWLRKDVLAATDVAAQKTTPAAGHLHGQPARDLLHLAHRISMGLATRGR